MEEDVLILLGVAFNLNLPLLTAWLLDHWLGDPAWLPHPVVAFGKAISFCEHRLNRGDSRFLKGALMTWQVCISSRFCYSAWLHSFLRACC